MTLRPPPRRVFPAPVEPVYPFNAPGEPITLYSGPIGGLGDADVTGVVELAFRPDLRLQWSITDGQAFINDDANVVLSVPTPAGQADLPGGMNTPERGWSNGASIGDEAAKLTRVRAHWINLPPLDGPQGISDGRQT